MAWNRTALALIGGGLVEAQLLRAGSNALRDLVSLTLIGLGAVIGTIGLKRWRSSEIAILIQLERMHPGTGLGLERAAGLFAFAAGGWDTRPDVPSPGGVFWVQQGRGVGARSHDRNTVSNAPNAQLGLHLAQLTGAPPDAVTQTWAERMIAWVEASLNAGEAGTGTGLFWDKIRADGSIDEMLWSYNQGSMVVRTMACAGPGVMVGKPANVATAERCDPSSSRCWEWNSIPTALRSGEGPEEGLTRLSSRRLAPRGGPERR